MSETNVNVAFPGLPTVLAIIFIVLKLTGYVTWSWWWVTSPLWIPPALFFGIIFAFLAFSFIILILFIIGLVVYSIINAIIKNKEKDS